MYFGTAEVFLAYVFTGNGLHNLRAGEEHVRDSLGHDGEVCEGGRVYSTAGAGTEDGRNLGNYARGHDVALENLGITGKSVDTFLNTCAARVVETDYRSAHLHGHIHHFADFKCHSLRKTAAEYGEVLCEDINEATVDCAVAGHNAVAEI